MNELKIDRLALFGKIIEMPDFGKRQNSEIPDFGKHQNSENAGFRQAPKFGECRISVTAEIRRNDIKMLETDFKRINLVMRLYSDLYISTRNLSVIAKVQINHRMR